MSVAAETITIISTGCSVSFTDPMLALAWVRVIVHDIPVEWFITLQSLLNPGDIDLMSHVREIASACMGTPA